MTYAEITIIETIANKCNAPSQIIAYSPYCTTSRTHRVVLSKLKQDTEAINDVT